MDYLKNLKCNDVVNSVYYIDYRKTKLERYKDVSGNKYVILKIRDKTLSNFEHAEVYFAYDYDSDLDFLTVSSKSAYIKVKGNVFSQYPHIKIASKEVVPAGSGSGIVFNTSDLFPYNDYFKNQLISVEGKDNVALRHTSIIDFQENYDLIEEGCTLQYRRVYDNPYDTNKIDVFIDDMEESYSIPAYLTPTMAKLIDDGYEFIITVTTVITPSEETHNAGIRVNIKGFR